MRRSKETRRGSVLLEFALIALVLFAILALTFDFGRAVFSAQVVQQSADHIARELAVAPLPVVMKDNFDLDKDETKNAIANVFSEDFLIIDISTEPLDINKLPSGNRLLVPLMIAMTHAQNPIVPKGSTWLVYPGAIVPDIAETPTPTTLTVRIPLVKYLPNGVEEVEPDTKKWLRVVEIDGDAFQLTSKYRGLASVRVNYPFQAAAISGRYKDPNDPEAPPQSFNDAFIEAEGDALQPGQVGGPYAGKDGLGQQAAFTRTVRPFRRIVTGQGVYRREIFQ